MNPFLQQALNNAWANATFYGALAGLPEGAFAAPRPGFFGSLERTLNHIYEVDLFYLDALTGGGKGRTVYDRDDIPDPAELGQRQAESDMALASYCNGLTGATLSEERDTERRDGTVTERVDALLLHLFQHQIHHRGQAHVQLQDAGIDPPQLDEFHIRYDRAPSAQAYFASDT